MTEEERFWTKVNKNGPIYKTLGQCWLWTAGCFGRNKEYGCFYKTGSRLGMPAHRWSYENKYGLVDSKLVIDHQCEVKLCVNPAHLKAMSHRENILKGTGLAAQQAKQTHCKRGHSLEDAHKLSRNCRDCRVCRKLRASRRTYDYRKVHG